MDDEERLTEVLREMQGIWLEASGACHAHLDALLDPVMRRDARTRNYLASGASGTLRDRIFSSMNGDRFPGADAKSVNERHRQLLDEATTLSVRLGLPATADW
jgi:hypothetical protein